MGTQTKGSGFSHKLDLSDGFLPLKNYMRTIIQATQPPCLSLQQPAQNWGEFIETICHDLVRESLLKEQYFLCCYCEHELESDEGHIEHLAPRRASPNRTYDYSNIAISCNGGNVEHCGHFKDNRGKNPNYKYDKTLFSTPHDPSTCALFCYLLNGEIQPAPDLCLSNQKKAEYMIGYLGLNCPRLVGRRKDFARRLINTLGCNPTKEIVQWAIDYYLIPDDNGRLKSFVTLAKTLSDP
jgi:uncharacterized protein (TIGR02646 family)